MPQTPSIEDAVKISSTISIRNLGSIHCDENIYGALRQLDQYMYYVKMANDADKSLYELLGGRTTSEIRKMLSMYCVEGAKYNVLTFYNDKVLHGKLSEAFYLEALDFCKDYFGQDIFEKILEKYVSFFYNNVNFGYYPFREITPL